LIAADSQYKRKLKKFLTGHGFQPRNLDLYIQAFTHSSAARKPDESYELLEFLGDSAILAYVVRKLVEQYPHCKVGLLSKAKSQIVSGETLSHIAYEVKLDRFILIDESIHKSSGRIPPGIMADTLEALTGAILLDLGIVKVRKFLGNLLTEAINIDLRKQTASDYKSILQEELQRRYKKIPSYELVKTSGPDHDKTFYVGAIFAGIKMGRGKGRCKKDAEQHAACETLNKLDMYVKRINRKLAIDNHDENQNDIS
jgi:ribonuclease-3